MVGTSRCEEGQRGKMERWGLHRDEESDQRGIIQRGTLEHWQRHRVTARRAHVSEARPVIQYSAPRRAPRSLTIEDPIRGLVVQLVLLLLMRLALD